MTLCRHFVSHLLFLSILIVITDYAPLPVAAQEAQQTQPTITVGGVEIKGLPDDWTHHHLVFSNPGMEYQAMENGTYDRWLDVVNNPRYIIQQLKRHKPAQGPFAEQVLEIESATRPGIISDDQELTLPLARGKNRDVHKDWSMGMDGAAATATGTVGTLSSSSISGSSMLTIGSVTFDASPPTAASATGTFTNGTAASGSVKITNGSNSLTIAPTTASTASIAFTSGSRPSSGSTVTIGSGANAVTYRFESNVGSGCSANDIYRGSSSSSNTTAIASLAAVLNGTGTAGTTYCAGTTTPNYVASGATATNAVNLTNTIGGSGQNGTTAFTTSSSYFGSESANWASGSGGVGFVSSTNGTMEAISLAAVIAANGGTVGVTATSSGAVVTVTAATPGTGGNSIALTDSLSEFSWSGSDLSNGSDGTTSGTTFAYWSVNNYVSSSVLATNIATAINANTTLEETTGVMANSSNNVVTVAARTNGTNSTALGVTSFSGYTWSGSELSGGATGTGKVQPNAYPAKYGVSLTGASCADFVVYPTGQAGATNVASVVAYYNLYTTGCTGAVPSVYWAYNTGGTVTTSPILSWDGSQVAFMQVSSSGVASLVLLKWAPGPPMTLTSQSSGAAYRSCTAPCMYTLPFANGKNDTFSSPFYDYGDNSADVLYVGDDSGNLHQFSGVFNGSPAESGTPWPVNLGTNKLSSPIYDCACGFQGGYVFVGDFGGSFYSVGTGYGGTTAGQVHGNTGSIGDVIADAPLVDSSEGTEYVFVTTNGSYSYTGDNGVWEFVSSFTDRGTPGVLPVGTGGAGYYLYAGDFDNVYYESGNPAYGHLYVVGNTGTAGGGTLYQVDIAYSSLTGTVNAVATGLNSTEHPWSSPLTEFCNNGTSDCTITSQRNVTGKVSTTSPEITLSSGTFTSADVGAYVTGTDIPFGDTISTVVSSSEANLTTAPTGNVTSESLAIQGGQTTSGTDYVFFSVNQGAKSGCTNSSGHGCILSYNITNPTSVALSGSGLNVTTPGTNGCWASGGFIIDNSDQSTSGAQQIYFVGLNGASAGGASGNTSSNCTSATANLNATQASQSNP